MSHADHPETMKLSIRSRLMLATTLGVVITGGIVGYEISASEANSRALISHRLSDEEFLRLNTSELDGLPPKLEITAWNEATPTSLPSWSESVPR